VRVASTCESCDCPSASASVALEQDAKRNVAIAAGLLIVTGMIVGGETRLNLTGIAFLLLVVSAVG
jgi:hypothetical protein